MRPVSAAYLRTVRGSCKTFVRARLVDSYQEGVDPDGVELPVVDGEVTGDATASIRGRLTMSVEGTGLFPAGPTDPLTPYGNEVHIAHGIAYGAGSTELVSLGYYRLYEVEQDDPKDDIQLLGFDRMSGIVDAKLEAPQEFVAGTSIADVFDLLVHEVYPTATILYDFPAATTFLLETHVADKDRYDFLRDFALAYGKVMHWDYAGQLRVASPPSTTSPVWQVNHGRNGVLVSAKRRLTRERVYNAVVATGERPSSDLPPVRAVARDMSTSSPTYYHGRFGPVPREFSSAFITDPSQAAEAAEKILRRSIGLPYEATLGALVNAALEVYDPVEVSYSDAGRREIHVLQTVSIPLSVDREMTMTTREQSTVTIGVEQ